MKAKSIIRLFLVLILSGVIVSCEKDNKTSEYTVENQTTTGNFTYVTNSFVPIAIDTVTMQPLSANISMDGSGTMTTMGKLTVLTAFKFDFVAGKGSDFVTTYTGENSADSFSATASSQMQPDGSITLTETFNNGKGRFAKIKGGGTTIVLIKPDQTGGTGAVTWVVTY